MLDKSVQCLSIKYFRKGAGASFGAGTRVATTAGLRAGARNRTNTNRTKHRTRNRARSKIGTEIKQTIRPNTSPAIGPKIGRSRANLHPAKKRRQWWTAFGPNIVQHVPGLEAFGSARDVNSKMLPRDALENSFGALCVKARFFKFGPGSRAGTMARAEIRESATLAPYD